ncbi:hypothetical protein ND16A_0629 [Thalassotalea sp. ND16A]|nr:hypothetical protein ND16A_0629 [Thalassotalea sp. ND16A]
MQRLTSAKNKWDSSPTWSPDAKTDTSEISIADSDGSNVIRLTQNNADDWYPEISPDGTQIVFMSDRDGNREIYTMDIDGSNQKRLTVNDVADWNPSWFADGSKLIFTSENKEDFFDIYMMNKDGSFQVISFCYFLELYLCFRLAKN